MRLRATLQQLDRFVQLLRLDGDAGQGKEHLVGIRVLGIAKQILVAELPRLAAQLERRPDARVVSPPGAG
jgi:hypothetical protein